MTNETTASQPKSIGDDAQFMLSDINKIIDLADKIGRSRQANNYAVNGLAIENLNNIKLSLFAKIQELCHSSGNLGFKIKTWEEREKSFEARFPDSGVSYVKYMQDEINDLRAVLYSRAPAAQASATIQAAPVTPFDTDEWEHMVNDWMNKTGIELRHTEYRTLVDIGNKFAAQFAATIQEPVMVAEPVNAPDQATSYARPIGPLEWREFAGSVYAAMRAFDGTWGKSSNEMRRQSLEDKAKRLMRARSSAAPMVADPAGVALEVLRDLARYWDKNHIDADEANEEMCAIEARVHAIIDQLPVALAATVKAVPSEALDLSKLTRYEPDGQSSAGSSGAMVWMEEAECGDWLKRSDVEALFAAPLADKTGGGE